MTSIFKKFNFLCLSFILSFCLVNTAEAQKSKTAPTLADKREIIKILLEEKFKNAGGETIKISRRNLPVEIQSDFPQIKNLQIRIVSEDSANENVCPYQIKFYAMDKDKNLSVSFGNCEEGLVYRYKKIRGKWKSVPFVIRN